MCIFGRYLASGWTTFNWSIYVFMWYQYLDATWCNVLRLHAKVTALTRDIVWSKTFWSLFPADVFGAYSSPHKLKRAMGIYIAPNVCYSSAFKHPAEASPKLYGTEFNQVGFTVVLTTSLMCFITSILLIRAGIFSGIRLYCLRWKVSIGKDYNNWKLSPGDTPIPLMLLQTQLWNASHEMCLRPFALIMRCNQYHDWQKQVLLYSMQLVD